MSTSALRRLFYETIHVDDGAAAQLRLEKEVHLKDSKPPGVGEIQSTPSSAVDNMFLLVDALNLILSFETGSDGDPETFASCRDRFRLIQNEWRRLVDKSPAYLVWFRVALTRGKYPDQVDTDIRESFQAYFQQLIQDFDAPTSKLHIRYYTVPRPAGRGM